MRPSSAPGQQAARKDVASRLEVRIARFLIWGTRLAMGFVLLGVLGSAAAGVDPLAPTGLPPFSLARIPGDLVALRPEGFLWAGLTIVVALPVGRVAVAGAGFAAAGDRRLVLVSAAVLVVIAVSVIAAVGLGG